MKTFFYFWPDGRISIIVAPSPAFALRRAAAAGRAMNMSEAHLAVDAARIGRPHPGDVLTISVDEVVDGRDVNAFVEERGCVRMVADDDGQLIEALLAETWRLDESLRAPAAGDGGRP